MLIKDIDGSEFWLDIATLYGDPCDFIDNKPHAHPSATNIHVIRKSAYDTLQAENKRLKGIEQDHMTDYLRIQKAERECERLNTILAGHKLYEDYQSEIDQLKAELADTRQLYYVVIGQRNSCMSEIKRLKCDLSKILKILNKVQWRGLGSEKFDLVYDVTEIAEAALAAEDGK